MQQGPIFQKCSIFHSNWRKREVISLDCVKMHGDFFNFLNRSRYELSVITKKFRFGVKGCKIEIFVLNSA